MEYLTINFKINSDIIALEVPSQNEELYINLTSEFASEIPITGIEKQFSF